MENPKCIICGANGFNSEIAMCYDCALTVVMVDDIYPPETLPTIKPLAYRIWDIVTDDDDTSIVLVCPDCGRETTDDEEIFCPDCGHGWQPEYENME